MSEIANRTALSPLLRTNCRLRPGVLALLCLLGALPLATLAREEVPVYRPINDPIERFNRGVGFLNHGIMMGVVDPTSRVYRFILPRPVRESVNKAGTNLAYPVRFVNNLLQAEFADAWTDTKRFGVNTTVGFLGFFDPATGWGIETYPEDTGRTFCKWGWNQNFYLMLPFFGPSNDRDTFGKVGDTALNPATYLFPASPIFTYNRLSDEIIPYKQLTSTQYDPYVLSRDVWSITRFDAENLVLSSPDRDDPALQTLNAIYLSSEDRNFTRKGDRRKVLVPSTGERIGYNLWMQKNPSMIVYVIPGLGGHRESSGALAMAEMLYNRGYSVVTISSAMNWEFIQKASTALVPGYAPIDARDTLVVIEAIHAELLDRYADRIRGRALMGVSLGAFHTLMIAEEEASRDDLPETRFERYIAINPPVDLIYGMKQLDSFYNTPLVWPAGEREDRMRIALQKTATAALRPDSIPDIPPITREEARFLIGLWYRLSLRDVIHCSQYENDLGIIQSSLDKMKRDPAYREIGEYSYLEYLESFVLPALRQSNPQDANRESILRASNLRSRQNGLARNPKIRVFTNRNDFLLSPEDLEWMERIFGNERIDIAYNGGHMGNLYISSIQDRICQFLQ
ncbi:MAG: VacJ family lipoprotein [Candidatus Omnitrophica bacterium]|nr:VacJ family lipoprotein [Candidatus Omnitrophota bacterium]